MATKKKADASTGKEKKQPKRAAAKKQEQVNDAAKLQQSSLNMGFADFEFSKKLSVMVLNEMVYAKKDMGDIAQTLHDLNKFIILNIALSTPQGALEMVERIVTLDAGLTRTLMQAIKDAINKATPEKKEEKEA